MSIGLIITCAGSGERLGLGYNKVLAEINNHPLIYYTLNCFKDIDQISTCIITVKAEEIATFQEIIDKINLPFKIKIIEGGDTRQQSVKNAVESLENCQRVMIHDGARPAVSNTLIQSLLNNPNDHVIPGLPLTDTIKRVASGQVQHTENRDTLYAIQTPQLFKRDTLLEAYQSTKITATDESTLIEALNKPVHVIPGEKENLKVTYEADLALFASRLPRS